MRTYYSVIEQSGMYRGQVYRYDRIGANAIVLWTSDNRRDTRSEALDDAINWLEDNNVEADLE
jgi:hypothetical protein